MNVKKLSIALGGAILIGIVHGVAHYIFGNPTSFVDAGVTPVGLAVTIMTFFVIYGLHLSIKK